MTKQYDILLVFGHFRSVTSYLSIIQHLSPKCRVGLLQGAVDPSFLEKTTRGQNQFLELATKFGAQIVRQGERIDATLMVVQQYPYLPETAAGIREHVRAGRIIGLLGFATAGLVKHDSFLEAFKPDKLYVPNKRFMQFLLRARDMTAIYEGREIAEVGLPFGKYSVFPEFQVDYLIAAPTVFSFNNELGRHRFLETILDLLQQIPRTAVIAYKTHNGNTRDYFAPTLHYAIARIVRRIPGARGAMKALSRRAPRWLSGHVQRVQTGILHLAVLSRAVPMTQLSKYADISMEAFLPGVRNGVIGGLSNAIWGTLYFALPYYNCVDPATREGPSELLPHKSSEALLDLNLRYFGVPYCYGDLRRGASGENIVTMSDRAADLITCIETDLDAQRTAPAAAAMTRVS